jgi:hypothetical protein
MSAFLFRPADSPLQQNRKHAHRRNERSHSSTWRNCSTFGFNITTGSPNRTSDFCLLSPSTTLPQSSRPKLGKLPDESCREEFERQWSQVTKKVRVGTAQSSSESKGHPTRTARRLWWPSLSPEVLAEDLDPHLEVENQAVFCSRCCSRSAEAAFGCCSWCNDKQGGQSTARHIPARFRVELTQLSPAVRTLLAGRS